MSIKTLKRVEFFTRKLKEFRFTSPDRLNPKWKKRALRLAKYQDAMEKEIEKDLR